jgi:hyperosmotically inducible protein
MRTTYLASAATVALVALGGCAGWPSHSADRTSAKSEPAEPRGPVTTTADAAITAKVKTAFAADELVKAHNINVDTVRGVVQLTGTVKSAAEKDRAISLAKNVSGVVEVKDNLRTAG